MTANSLGIDETSRGSFDDLETEVSTGHEFKDHVKHALRAVGLQQLHNVWVLEHVANRGLALQVVEAEAGTGSKFGHIDDLDGELLAGLPVNASSDQRKWAFACKYKKDDDAAARYLTTR